jgi:hypothetical protein
MFQLKLAAVVGGVMLAYFGIQEFRVSQGTSEEPVAVDLEQILIVEDGRAPASTTKSLGMTAGGVLISLLGVGGFLMDRGDRA